MTNTTNDAELAAIKSELEAKIDARETERTEADARISRPAEPETDPDVEAILPRAKLPDQTTLEAAAVGKTMAQLQSQIQQVRAAMNGSDMAALENSDPGRAALTRQKLQENLSYLTNSLVQQNVRAQNLGSRHLEAERQKLADSIPGWHDARTRDTETAQLRAWLSNKGYAEQQLSSIGSAETVQKLYRQWKQATSPRGQAPPVRIKNPRVSGQKAFEDSIVERARQLVQRGRKRG